jgi:hypothetical protein
MRKNSAWTAAVTAKNETVARAASLPVVWAIVSLRSQGRGEADSFLQITAFIATLFKKN